MEKTRAIALWTALRDGDTAESRRLLDEFAEYLDQNPVVRAMRTAGKNAIMLRVFSIARTQEEMFWKGLPGGV